MCSRFSSCPLFEKRRFVAASPLPVKRAALREHRDLPPWTTCSSEKIERWQRRISKPAASTFFTRKRPNEIDDRSAHFRIGDARKCLVQFKPLSRTEKLDDVRLIRLLGEAGHHGPGALRARRRLVVKKLHGNAENLCEIEEAAGADPVDALLVLLHLLERQPQMLAKLFLAHAEQHPPQSDPRADMDIHRIGAPRSTRRLFAGSVLG